MPYWKIVAGHIEKDPDETKSLILGDWLRKDYISIGYEEDESQGKTFREEIKIRDKIVVVNKGYVWALGTIESEAKEVALPRGSHLYPCQRDVTWSKVTKVAYKTFPKFLYNKLKHRKTLNKLELEDWETLLTCIL